MLFRSLIWISGALELEAFTKKDGKSKDKRMKILLDNWGFIPVGKSKGHQSSKEQIVPETSGLPKVPEIDGDREPLPE